MVVDECWQTIQPFDEQFRSTTLKAVVQQMDMVIADPFTFDYCLEHEKVLGLDSQVLFDLASRYQLVCTLIILLLTVGSIVQGLGVFQSVLLVIW